VKKINNIKKAILTFVIDDNFISRDAEKLRGYFGNIYKDEIIFHNHIEGNKFLYNFPKIQYRVINGKFLIVGINEGAEVIQQKFFNIKELVIGNKIITNFEKTMELKEEEIYVADKLYTYKFTTPWLCINQKNHKRYEENKLDLDIVLRNNILSNLKGLNIFADKKIMVKGDYKEVNVKNKNINIIGFYGAFTTNVRLPEYIGIGKRKSIGFGCIENN